MVRYLAIAAVLLTCIGSAAARDRGYPYSIMNPEPGSRESRAARPQAGTLREPRARVKLSHRGARSARRGSGYVPSLTLPKTQAIPPVATSAPPTPLSQPHRPETVVPGIGVVPNLPPAVPGRRETFQDRAARCHHQMGVYGVPTGQTTAYMGACAN
jgi:hypothetical protein